MRAFDKEKKWYKEWFDSQYYHILYNKRDYKEAENFLTNLMAYLTPLPDSIFLDAACGKGRHAIYIEKLGFNIDGFDLSGNSIKIAKKHQNEQLKFYVNDIRKPLKKNYYNYVFNLFTSFGYFDDEKDNLLAISAISNSLKKNGLFVFDFLNSVKVINNIKELETKIISDITFNIKRSYVNNYITKDIHFIDKGESYHFQEKVKALTLANFKTYFIEANLKIEAIFGDYELNNFDENISDRLIIIARKN